MINNKAFSVETDESVEGWQTVTGVITPQHAAELYIGGKLAGRRLLPGFILTDPNDSMQIGADTGSPIVPSTTPKFQGEMKRVAIWRGARRPAP